MHWLDSFRATSPPRSAPAIAGGLAGGEAGLWSFDFPLLLDVLLEDGERGSAAGDDAVRPAPEDRLPVHTGKFRSELGPDEPGGNGLQIVHERGDVHLRVEGDEEMYMVPLPVELDELAFPLDQKAGEYLSEAFKHGFGDDLVAVFRD